MKSLNENRSTAENKSTAENNSTAKNKSTAENKMFWMKWKVFGWNESSAEIKMREWK